MSRDEQDMYEAAVRRYQRAENSEALLLYMLRDLKRRIRLARDIVRSRAWTEQRHYHAELLDYLDLRKPLTKRR